MFKKIFGIDQKKKESLMKEKPIDSGRIQYMGGIRHILDQNGVTYIFMKIGLKLKLIVYQFNIPRLLI